MASEVTIQEIIGLEPQKKILVKILLSFKKTKKGASCVLSGRRGSGKMSLLKSSHYLYTNSIPMIILDGEEHTRVKEFAEQGIIDKFDPHKNNGEQRIIVFNHFELFATKQDQKYLYSVLNGSQSNPWLVFMVGTTEHCISILEKRIQSRLCKTRINFDITLTHEQIVESFFAFLSTSMDKHSYQIIKNDSVELSNCIKKCTNRRCSLGAIKKLAIVFVASFPLKLEEETPAKILGYAMDSIWPTNDMMPLLQSIPLRQLCLLRCVMLVQERAKKLEVICREVINEYKRLTNDFDRSMQVSDDSILCRDLDELIFMSVIKLKNGTDVGQFEFRKIYLNVDKETIKVCFKDRLLPQKIQLWIE
ncbi:ORC (Origin Recognition Complex) subunit [Ditylenchus destructor]|uniref:ORC (Origin Recognition Complex) subunit n=1 Tax=Ditylenchus destructor TaxID=166010 RepID=A0AAD4NGR7_9BILA|nr:ORC (Origin Recognition Complex) subunit [Ditylenchus destructor]